MPSSREWGEGNSVLTERHALGVPATYWKVPFLWSGSLRAPQADPVPPGGRWEDAEALPSFQDLVAATLTGSVDAWDIAAVAALGPRRTAALVTTGLSGYHHQPGWWEALSLDDVPVGFVLPAVFEGCSRDGRDEGTIVHIGVHPTARGQGLGRLLLRRATRTLVEHGIWRIYCDTAENNVAMIRLFESEGWERQPAHERPVYDATTED